jgi:glycosyltransferase involved in cell wall biosynthesis
LERLGLDMQHTNELMVAVEMITYNHEKYIAQAIESVLMQKTNFRYKLIICEDKSTDKTAKICKEYQSKYPDKIDLYLNEKNLGIESNARKLHRLSSESKAKYIAMCEGDDYWTDSNKLQKQVQIMEANTDASLCFHNVNILFQRSNKSYPAYEANNKPPKITYLKDIAKGNYIKTTSALFRNYFGEMPQWMYESEVSDYTFYVLWAKRGTLHYIDEIMGCYRKHEGGWTSGRLQNNLNYEIGIFSNLMREFTDNEEVLNSLNSQINHRICRSAVQYFKNEDIERGLKRLTELKERAGYDLFFDNYLGTTLESIFQKKSFKLARKVSVIKQKIKKLIS